MVMVQASVTVSNVAAGDATTTDSRAARCATTGSSTVTISNVADGAWTSTDTPLKPTDNSGVIGSSQKTICSNEISAGVTHAMDCSGLIFTNGFAMYGERSARLLEDVAKRRLLTAELQAMKSRLRI
ncbi:110 kDa 4SNc-Tudor domain protein [Striga asiatica]|uniref:110 kDa 4SNc-Tudor domain protein n=1 Tax=Striga asiatica TaxID=4170 RepID=A0A5A7QVM8_STRAF|nr:110 kDa 4SNc-Tudor domain protein [Striga asiatica]